MFSGEWSPTPAQRSGSLPPNRRELRAACPLCLGGRPAVGALHHRGVSQEAGHEAADQHPVGPGVEGLRQRGGLHLDGVHWPHAHGAAPDGGAQSQASLQFSL